MRMTGGPGVRRLSRKGLVARLGATAAALTALTIGQLTDSNDLFPLGTLSQYATPRDMDGTVRSTYIVADTENGDQTRVPMGAQGIGLSVAEIEGQVNRFRTDPSLLQSIADAWAALHPDDEQYVKLHLRRDIYQLQDGHRQGDPTTEEIATWDVRR